MNEKEAKQAGSRCGRLIKWAITRLVIPVIASLVAGLIIGLWIGKDRVEMTCSLEGWIPLGDIEEVELEELEIMYAGQPVDNVLKVSWRIANTGSKGIKEFEKPPSITYPEDLTVVKASVSDKPMMLKVDEDATIDPEKKVIEVDNIGTLNEEESFRLDVYMVNVRTTNVSPEFFEGWQFSARALDLVTEMDLETKQAMVSTEDGAFHDYSLLVILVFACSLMVATGFVAGYARSVRRAFEERILADQENKDMLTQKLASLQSHLKGQQESEMARIMAVLGSVSASAEHHKETAKTMAIDTLTIMLDRYGISVEEVEHGAKERAIRLRKGLSRMDIVIPSTSLTDYTEGLRKMLFGEQDLS